MRKMPSSSQNTQRYRTFFILLYLTDGKGGIWGRVGEEFNETVDTKAPAPTSISLSSQLEEVSNKTTNAIFSILSLCQPSEIDLKS